MNLQETFYILGIIYMVVTLILYLFVVIALFALKKKIDTVTRTIEEKVDFVSQLAHDPTRFAMMFGSSIASKAVKKVTTVMRKKT